MKKIRELFPELITTFTKNGNGTIHEREGHTVQIKLLFSYKKAMTIIFTNSGIIINFQINNLITNETRTNK